MSGKPKHFTIPVFIPMQGCPFECVFCNQHNITGQQKQPPDDQMIDTIESHLLTISTEQTLIEVGFFGGSFTGLPEGEQTHYLNIVRPYIESKKVIGVRLSTRPDYITHSTLKRLARHGVTAIELGVQSMDDEVLRLSGRGHNTNDVRQAATLIKHTHFELGLQMMVGLPGDSLGKCLETARQIISLGAGSTRIYPALVIRNTHLEKLYIRGDYIPLTLEEAVEWCSAIVPLFENAGVTILRLGLHPSEGLLNGRELVAGPFHVAFGEMVYTRIWSKLLGAVDVKPETSITVYVHPKQINAAIGHRSANKKQLQSGFRQVRFFSDETLIGRAYHVDYR